MSKNNIILWIEDRPRSVVMSKNNIILWIEDRPIEVIGQIEQAKRAGYQVEVIVTTETIQETLETGAVIAIIVDVMLFGMNDLRGFNIKGASTDSGLETGWAIIESFLRLPTSTYRDIPILVVSGRAFNKEQQQRLAEIKQLGGGDVRYLEKYRVGWQNEFSEWLNGLAQKEKTDV